MRSGDLIAGRFEIDREVGAGGMGRVFRARDRHAGVDVAVKVVLDEEGEIDPRFAREAVMLAEIAHPAVVKYVAHGETPDGYPFLAMEWLEGEDLSSRLRQRYANTTVASGRANRGRPAGALTVAEVLVLARRIAAGLGALHARNLVHRDVKPGNVFLPGGDVARAKLLDFGLARPGGRSRALTLTGVAVGTPSYMAPEQARGSRELDARADVWSLGCLIYECFAGAPPFRGQHMMAILAKILLEPAPRLSEVAADVPPLLDELVARMLEKDLEARPRDCGEVERALASIEASTPAPAARAVPAPTPSLGSSEQRVFAVLVAGRTGSIDRPDLSSTFEGEVGDRLRDLGGRIESLADGSMLVMFDGPRVAVDQASRAARAALAVRALLPNVPLAVSTGRAETGERLSVGELLDRAIETLARATDGRIRLDALTAGLVESRFRLEREGDDAFLVGSAEAGERARTLLGKPSAWVGREREIAMLEAVFVECASEPMARAVLVTAPAGTGKSRLRQELLTRLAARDEPPSVLFAQGDSLSAGSPFVMIAPAVRRSADIRDGEPLEVRRAKLAARVARNVPPAERDRVTMFLGELVQAPFEDAESEALRAARRDPMLMGDAMRAAFETFLEAECEAGPVVLVLEDLHWGDLPAVKFVDGALRSLRDKPFLVLALARPEVHQSFPGLWGERALIEVRLDALSRKASERLVRLALGRDVAQDAVDRVVARAEGNAFFLEELIRAVASGQTGELPDTVLGTLQARLDALGPDAKRVLRGASVFGEVFWGGGVAALLGAEESARTGEWVGELVLREIVTQLRDSRVPGEVEYAFRHALVRDAAYAMLTERDRALGHRLAAVWLESRGEHEALVLAQHYDRGNDREAALRWFRRAAEQALEGNDLAAAVDRAERAISCGAIGETLGALRALQASACYWQSRYADAQTYAREACSLLAPGSSAAFRAGGEAIVSSARRGQPDEVDAFLDAARAATPEPGAEGTQIVCLCRGAFQLVFAGRFEKADALLVEIAALAGDVDALDPAVAAQVHHVRGVRAAHAGHVGEFMEHLERALASFDQAGDRKNVALERPTLGWCYAELGELAKAVETLRSAAEACERLGVTQTRTYALVNLAYALALRGEIEEAGAVQTAAAEACRAQGNPRLEGWSRTHLSTLSLGRGDSATAEREASTAAELLVASPGLCAWANAALARARLARGNLDGALATSEAAYTTLRSLGSILQCEALVPLARAESLAAAGRTAERDEVLRYARARLLERADRLSPHLRETFLALPDHAATLTSAATHLGTSLSRYVTSPSARRTWSGARSPGGRRRSKRWSLDTPPPRMADAVFCAEIQHSSWRPAPLVQPPV